MIVINILSVILLLFVFYKTSFGYICSKEPLCYCSAKNDTKILCKNVTDLSHIVTLLDKYPQIYSLRIYGPHLTDIPENVFENRSIVVLAITAPLQDIPDQTLSGIEDLQTVEFDGSRFPEVPKAFGSEFLETVRLVNGSLAAIDDQLQNNSMAMDFSFAGNEIREISPNAFLNANSMQRLNLSRNQIEYLDNKTFTNAKKLTSIDLSYNLLYTVDGLFDGLDPMEILLYGNNLTSIDKAFHRGMWETKWLDIGGNPNLNLTPSTFDKIMPNLWILSLNDNLYDELDPNLLHHFTSLNRLYLNGNHLTNIPAGFLNPTTHLKRIELADNKLTSTEDIFPPNSTAKLHFLERVRLDGNELESIRFGSSAKNIQRLDLSRNRIGSLRSADFENLPNLISMNLSGNPVIQVEADCFGGLQKLKTLDLSGTKLSRLNRSVRHMVELDRLVIESSSLAEIDSGELVDLGELRIVELRNNELRSVYLGMRNLTELGELDLAMNNLTTLTGDSLPIGEKNPTTFRKLWLEGNPLSCDCRISWIIDWLKQNHSLLEDEPTCHGPSNLKDRPVRSLNQSELIFWKEDCPDACDCDCNTTGENVYTDVDCTNRDLTTMPARFPVNAKEIDLHENDIVVFKGFGPLETPSLQVLNLENNKISSVRLVLPPSTATLNLAGNNMSRFPFEEWNATRLQKVELSRNPWICDCEAWGFVEWLIAHNNSVPDSNDVRCVGDGNFANSVLIQLNREDLCPNQEKGTKITIIIAALSAFLLFLIILGCFIFRHTLAACCYSLGCHCLKEEESQQYSFDAFLLYADEDEEFVTSKLVEGLEGGSPSFKLFIPTRHIFLTSSPLNIESSLNDCCKVIVVLTREFLQNAQCMQLLKSSMGCSIEHTSNRLIFITKEDIDPTMELDAVLGAVVKNSTELRWGYPLFWSKLRYNMPKKHRISNNEESQPFLAAEDN